MRVTSIIRTWDHPKIPTAFSQASSENFAIETKFVRNGAQTWKGTGIIIPSATEAPNSHGKWPDVCMVSVILHKDCLRIRFHHTPSIICVILKYKDRNHVHEKKHEPTLRRRRTGRVLKNNEHFCFWLSILSMINRADQSEVGTTSRDGSQNSHNKTQTNNTIDDLNPSQ